MPAPGWVYRHFSYDPDTDGDAKEWREQLTADGWEQWMTGKGAWATINGRRLFGVNLRRWAERPNATPPR